MSEPGSPQTRQNGPLSPEERYEAEASAGYPVEAGQVERIVATVEQLYRSTVHSNTDEAEPVNMAELVEHILRQARQSDAFLAAVALAAVGDDTFEIELRDEPACGRALQELHEIEMVQAVPTGLLDEYVTQLTRKGREFVRGVLRDGR